MISIESWKGSRNYWERVGNLRAWRPYVSRAKRRIGSINYERASSVVEYLLVW